MYRGRLGIPVIVEFFSSIASKDAEEGELEANPPLPIP